MPHPNFFDFWTPNKKKCEFKWLRHIAHLLWYSQPCWRTQDFLMKPVTIHHILIFSFYIALRCQKLKIPKPHLNNPPRCPCRTQFFLTFGHQTKKQPCGQRILAMPANSVHDFAWQCVDFDADSALKKIIMASNTWFDDGALVEETAMSSKSVLPNQNMNELSFVERHQHPSKRCFDEAVLVKENLMPSKGKFFPTKISPDW